MQDNQDHKGQRHFYLAIGSICFILLSMIAMFFFKERTVFCDTAFQLVYLLVKQKPIVMPVRMGAGLSQLIPLSAVWLGADLKTVMIIHSLSTLILYAAIFLMAYLLSKKSLVFFIIPLSLTLIVNDVFYWTVSDVQVGLIWLGLYAVIIFEDRWRDKAWLWPVHFLFILWVQVFHLLLFLPILFLVIYYYDSISRLFSKQFFIHILLCLVAFTYRYYTATHDWYERGKINIWSNLRTNLPHVFSLESAQLLFRNMHFYFIYFAVLVMGVLWLLFSKKYFRALVVIAFSVGHWLLVVVTDPNDSGFYLENMLLPLGFIAALSFVADILPSNRWLAPLFALLMIVRVVTIYDAHEKYSDRLKTYDRYIRYARSTYLNGVFVDANRTDKDKFFMPWGSGFESMLLSGLDGNDGCVIVQIDSEPARFDSLMHSGTLPIMTGPTWDKAKIPPQYFKFKGKGYEIIGMDRYDL
jgi:hypothetical protein